MILNIPYLSAYGDVNSTAFKTKAAEIQLAILKVLQSKGVIGVKVVSLTDRGVAVQMLLALNASNINTTDIMEALNNAITNNQLLSINATGTVNVQGTVICFIFTFISVALKTYE